MLAFSNELERIRFHDNGLRQMSPKNFNVGKKSSILRRPASQLRHVIWTIFYTKALSHLLVWKKAMTRVLKNQSTSSAPFVWKHVCIEYHPYTYIPVIDFLCPLLLSGIGEPGTEKLTKILLWLFLGRLWINWTSPSQLDTTLNLFNREILFGHNFSSAGFK